MNSPRYLNLFKIALPLPGVSSILHRISAIAIFVLSLPMMGILVFCLSSEANYQLIISNVRAVASPPPIHNEATPFLRLFFFNALIKVVTILVPDAPTG